MEGLSFIILVVGLFIIIGTSRRATALERDIFDLRNELHALRRKVQQQAPSPAPAQPSAAAGVWPEHPPSPTAAASTPVTETFWKPADKPSWQDWSETPAPTPAPASESALPPSATYVPEDMIDEPSATPAPAAETVSRRAVFDRKPPAPPEPPHPQDFEFNFGKKLPVWIGGVALAFAGFYLVKYSIDMGLLTPEVRIILGFLFGVALLAAGSFIRMKKPDMADGARIAQAVTGAGIADLYATIFAATTMLHLIYPPAGFVAMALVTALAVILSVRHGMPIAILGLLGGFLTPALIQTGHPNAAALFTYLLMLVGGFFTVISMLAWWVLAIPVLLLSFLWVPVWLVTDFRPDDGIWLSFFLLAVTAVALFAAQKAETPKALDANPYSPDLGRKTSYLAVAGSVVLMALVTGQSNFAIEDWWLYGILGTGCLGLAWFKPSEYALAPWLSMIASLLMLAIWNHADDATYALTLLAFAVLYNLGSFMLLRGRPTLKAAGLLSAAALSFYGLAYFRLKERLYDLLSIAHTETLHLWGMIALVLAAGFTALTALFMKKFRGEDALRQQILAVTALTATAFMSVALTIEVDTDSLPVAFAAEILAVCWINLKVDIKALREIAAILFGVFIFLMGDQLLMLASVVVNSLFGQSLDFWHGRLPLAEDPMFHIGLPMLMIGGSAWLVQRQRDGKLAEVFEMATAALGALLIYYATRHVFHVEKSELFHRAGFFERGVITNLFFGAGLAIAYAGRQLSRRAVVWSGSAIFAMAAFRVFWFDFLTSNPLFNAHMDVGSTFLFNSLVFPYLLPCFWLWLEDQPQLRLVTMSRTLRGSIMLVLLFTFISYNVRNAFHPNILTEGVTPNAEVYAYSVVWLVLGGLLLFLGTMLKDKALRVASLVLIVLTIAKVFLYDASELTGLYRVFSFMGLGLSLLALSWFYSRFVFKDKS